VSPGSVDLAARAFGYQLSLSVESVSGVVGDDGQECGAPGWVEADDDAVALGYVKELGDVVDRVSPYLVIDGGVVAGVVQEDDFGAASAGSLGACHDAGAGEERGADLVALDVMGSTLTRVLFVFL